MTWHAILDWGRVVLVFCSPLLVSAALRHATRARRRACGALVRWGVLREPPEQASGLPLERLAADLRRLYPDAHFPRRGLGMPKQRGILLAYDRRLAETALALRVPTTLCELPVGVEREAERLRVEHALAQAGVVWQVQPGRWHADPAA